MSHKFNLILFFFFLSITSIQAKIEGVIEKIPLLTNPNLPKIAPVTKENEIIISREEYVLSYNKEKRIPNWVSWTLNKEDLGDAERSSSFSRDFDLEKYFKEKRLPNKAVTSTEYAKSCFDRGHQVPSGDRTKNYVNNKSTFYMSNMAPQTPYLNRYLWKNLEVYTRNYILTKNKKAYVIAGPILDQELGYLGPKKDILIPSKFFKIIFFIDEKEKFESISDKTEYIAVIMPNILNNGTIPNEDFIHSCQSFALNDVEIEGETIALESSSNHSNVSTSISISLQIEAEQKKEEWTLIDESRDEARQAPQRGKILQYNNWQDFKTNLNEIEKVSGLKLI